MEKLYINKEDCCGCSACLNICPKHAIYMKQDEKGYLYPEIRKDSCVNCRLCEKVCPLKEKEKNKKFEKIFHELFHNVKIAIKFNKLKKLAKPENNGNNPPFYP